MSPRFPPGLLAVTDRSQARVPLLRIVEAALDAGFAGVMLREKDLQGRALLELALPLAEACVRRDRVFLVNDRLDVALALPEAGGHVGARGIPVEQARMLLGERLLGYSAHEVDEAQEALARGADYVTLSPIYASASKPELAPRGVEFLARGASLLPPGTVVALAGLDAARLPEVRRAGAAGAAVMGALMRSTDPATTARALVEAWEGAAPDK